MKHGDKKRSCTKQSYSLPTRPVRAEREFHVSKEARDQFDLDDSLFSLHGTALFADLSAAQRAAYQMNQKRDVARFPELAVKASDLYAAGLLDELLHLVVQTYREQVSDALMGEALEKLSNELGQSALNETLTMFATLFPATSVYRGEQTVAEYLSSETDDVPHKQVVLEELLLLYLANENQALGRFITLFDDRVLEENTVYLQVIAGLRNFFAAPEHRWEGDSLFDTLRAPALASPSSLSGQLEYVRTRLRPLLGERVDTFFTRVLQGLDVLKEENKPAATFGGPGPAHVLSFDAFNAEDAGGMGAAGQFRRNKGDWATRGAVGYERYSPDQAWMPRVVMLAKSTYVWLGQLSETYGRDIRRLSDVPDEELDELARRGFTGLWLIGLWERSEASKRIKHLRGNPDAVASAYALYDYEIAHDLGGEAAFESLRDRAWARGIRLASDMVPNHVGVDGRWVVEHPDWFLSVNEPPYPGYTFDGPDLSSDERVGIFIEDHYYDSSDASVVFKRLDRQTGDVRYVYHGNDGTVTPWNDTAQLNYLNPETREGVIQTILHVARKFPIIRFDAAMTLAKVHVERLWFPEPGEGGAIPSRAQYGSMSNEEFDRLMPQEFWREVVDRVAQEVPDTLLLAEAFWMMEPYFVRTLGMHRVYNSAFMHMMMQEENAKYRQTLKNTLEFDPEILKRFVNFMNNPDEETAVAQFGKDDKYFGVAILLSTLPGLPMYGHGQVEGFHEKYGMEYRRAKLSESPDMWLIDRHYRELFPLLHRRAEFAEVENFTLYDLYTAEGTVNEDVFAYSNRYGETASLVVYNNKFAQAKGWLKRSTAYKDKGSGELRQRDLNEGLGVHGDDEHFVMLREHISGLEYLKRSRDVQNEGLYVELEAFKYRVYLDVREVHDVDGRYQRLYDMLGSRGIPSLEDALQDLTYAPVYGALNRLLDTFEEDEARTAFEALLGQAKAYGVEAENTATETFVRLTKALREFPLTFQADEAVAADAEEVETPQTSEDTDLRAANASAEDSSIENSGEDVTVTQDATSAYLALIAPARPMFLLWSVAQTLSSKDVSPAVIAEKLDLARYARRLVGREVTWLELLLTVQPVASEHDAVRDYLSAIQTDETVLNYLKVNEHDGVRWFDREAYRNLVVGFVGVHWLFAQLGGSERRQTHTFVPADALSDFARAEAHSGYRLDGLTLPPKLPLEAKADASSTVSKTKVSTVKNSKTPDSKASKVKAKKAKVSKSKSSKPKASKIAKPMANASEEDREDARLEEVSSD